MKMSGPENFVDVAEDLSNSEVLSLLFEELLEKDEFKDIVALMSALGIKETSQGGDSQPLIDEFAKKLSEKVGDKYNNRFNINFGDILNQPITIRLALQKLNLKFDFDKVLNPVPFKGIRPKEEIPDPFEVIEGGFSGEGREAA